MHERFQEEMDRQAMSLDGKVFDPPPVRCLNDIRRLLNDLDPRISIAQSTTISSEMKAEDEGGRQVTYRVSARADSHSKRAIVLKGMQFIKDRIALEERRRAAAQPVLVNGREMLPPTLAAADGITWVDPLIKRWFNAERDGLYLAWTVKEGRYLYDVFDHRLFRARQEAAE